MSAYCLLIITLLLVFISAEPATTQETSSSVGKQKNLRFDMSKW